MIHFLFVFPKFHDTLGLCSYEYWVFICRGTFNFQRLIAFSQLERHPPGESNHMKSNSLRYLRDSEGKGLFGCVVLIVLFILALFVTIKLAPIYYANYNMESEIKTEVSRAGARALTDDIIVKDVLSLAKRNNIQLKKEDITVQRFAGQIHIEVNYSVPVDFLIFERGFDFRIKESSFIGSL